MKGKKYSNAKILHAVISYQKNKLGHKFKGGAGYLDVASLVSGSQVTEKWQAKTILADYAIAKGLIPENLKKPPRVFSGSKPEKPKKERFEVTDAFLESYEWRKVRMQALVKFGARCMCCGISPADGAVMNVDHIKPRRKYPELALSLDNLQILCATCNHGKGNWDETDWRQEEHQNVTHIREIVKGN